MLLSHYAMKVLCVTLFLLLIVGQLLALSGGETALQPFVGTLQHFLPLPTEQQLHEDSVRIKRSPRKIRWWGKFQKKRPWRPRRRSRRPLPDPPTLPPYLKGTGKKNI
ncbi:hypothetical protein C0J52_19475 [Blattella germanica]|nr:hypothetical protein C0J52_19475 [Blattella germanica]